MVTWDQELLWDPRLDQFWLINTRTPTSVGGVGPVLTYATYLSTALQLKPCNFNDGSRSRLVRNVVVFY